MAVAVAVASTRARNTVPIYLIHGVPCARMRYTYPTVCTYLILSHRTTERRNDRVVS
jgi:hypothetical protein